MANHRFDIHELETGYKAVCLCRAESSTQQHRWQAEDWGREHLALVERVKAHLTRGALSLPRARDFYRQQEADETKPAAERLQWKALADEIDQRLNDQGPANEGQDALFSLETERQEP